MSENQVFKEDVGFQNHYWGLLNVKGRICQIRKSTKKPRRTNAQIDYGLEWVYLVSVMVSYKKLGFEEKEELN